MRIVIQMPQLGDIKKGREIGKGISRTGQAQNYIWVACEDCGKERWVCTLIGKPKARVCAPCQLNKMHTPVIWRKISHTTKALRRNGDKHPGWKGGRVIDHEGYVHIYYAGGFFSPMAGMRTYIREHRLVMAKFLNRCLLPWEVVHHKNGNKQDNRLENLSLLRGRVYHSGLCILESENRKLRKTIITLTKRNEELEEICRKK